MNDPKLHIEAYLEGSLSSADLKAFEKALQEDGELKDLVENFDLLKKSSDAILELGLLDEVKNVRSNSDAHKRGGLPKWILYLFGVVLGIWIVYTFFGNNNISKKAKSSHQLIAEVYTEPIWPVSRSSKQEDLQRAVALYLEGDILASRQIFSSGVIGRDTANYWMAELFMKESQVDSVSKYLPTFDPSHKYYSRSVYLKNRLDILISKQGKSPY